MLRGEDSGKDEGRWLLSRNVWRQHVPGCLCWRKDFFLRSFLDVVCYHILEGELSVCLFTSKSYRIEGQVRQERRGIWGEPSTGSHCAGAQSFPLTRLQDTRPCSSIEESLIWTEWHRDWNLLRQLLWEGETGCSIMLSIRQDKNLLFLNQKIIKNIEWAILYFSGSHLKETTKSSIG